LPPEVRFEGLNAPNSILTRAPPQTALELDLWSLLNTREGGLKEREGRNVEFHHLRLSNLTTEFMPCVNDR